MTDQTANTVASIPTHQTTMDLLKNKMDDYVQEVTVQKFTWSTVDKVTPEILLRIRALAALGLSKGKIGEGIGLNSQPYFAKLCKDYPEMQAAIDAGRFEGASKLIAISWDAAYDKKDNARNSEIARLHRIFRTEEEANGEPLDPSVSTEFGFKIEIVRKENSSDIETENANE